jgi:2-polyprenyl-3-methyl-5-hydroxy-6-metoxy-1,4-benzoquinol methylase
LTEENIELEILDVGAGYGSFVATALENGHKASGVEISEHSAMIANQNGLSVQVGQIRNISFLREFNVITFWDVIEHMTEIDENIKYINDNLRNKSLILIATDNYDSLIVDIAKVLYYVFKWKWPMSRYLIPQNTVYFTPATLNALMKKYKFKLLHHEQIDYPISKINLSLLQKPLVTLLYWMGRKKKRQSQFLSIYQKE